jgi:hypothetical protein
VPFYLVLHGIVFAQLRLGVRSRSAMAGDAAVLS